MNCRPGSGPLHEVPGGRNEAEGKREGVWVSFQVILSFI